MKIETWNIERVIPYAGNPRDNDDAVDGVANSIKEFGFQQPIVVDSDGVVIAGHTRLKAAKKLGLESVPVLVADSLTSKQVKAYRIVDNRTSEKAKWIEDLLWKEIEESGFELEFLGFEVADERAIEAVEWDFSDTDDTVVFTVKARLINSGAVEKLLAGIEGVEIETAQFNK